jgi:hypothetical protein
MIVSLVSEPGRIVQEVCKREPEAVARNPRGLILAGLSKPHSQAHAMVCHA